jgi:hypothetical protein
VLGDPFLQSCERAREDRSPDHLAMNGAPVQLSVALAGCPQDNVSAFPLGLVFDKANVAVRDMPYDSLTWYQFSDLLGASVKVFVVELKLGTEFVGTTVNFR